MGCRLPPDQVAELKALAEHHFAKDPLCQSIMLVVADYHEGDYGDLLSEIVFSRRNTPLWPHECLRAPRRDEQGNQIPCSEVDRCSCCILTDPDLPYPPVPPEEYNRCIAGVCYDRMAIDDYEPFAVARRTPAGVEIEELLRLQRPPTRHCYQAAEREVWITDPGARALYGELCRTSNDTAVRLLADYLSERGQPHGELLRLELEENLDPALEQRRADLRGQVHRAWLAPLSNVLDQDATTFHRGFLRAATVWQHDSSPGRAEPGAPAWATLQSLEIVGPASFLDSAMISLREVGTVDGSGLQTISSATAAWAIEDLTVYLQSEAAVEDLTRTMNLPCLRRLRVKVRDATLLSSFAERLQSAPWWPPLTRLCLDALPIPSGCEWASRIGRPIAVVHGDWEIFVGSDRWEARLLSWRSREHSSLSELVRLLDGLDVTVSLRPSRFYVPEPVDLEMIRYRFPGCRARFELAQGVSDASTTRNGR